ncbi:WASH complex subunit 4 [Parasteatoda tepidariorum]|uniref:WASH complex subunit 4 n=1 Tax=Parasteatoda tepidariorum TaxID=114398 RepID=UPI001C71DA52|nr:WASH complex subunit 4 [Parasteatoda tepidariorum]
MIVDVKEWDVGTVDDGVIKIVEEVQLRKYGKFLEGYSTQLKDIEHALDETINDFWSQELEPVSIQLSPLEKTTVLELVSTDNKILNKVISVLSILCCEVDDLCYEAKVKFFPALLFYGEGESPDALVDGEAHIYIGRMIPFMQELSCFVERCYVVVKNIIHQLNGLHSGHKNGTAALIDVTDVHFLTVYKYLGSLLTILVTLDEIIDSQVVLREHWTQFKRMLVSIHHKPSKLGIESEKLRPFEKLINKLENQLLEGSIFLGAVEQNFDDNKNFVTKNTFFLDEFNLNIRKFFMVIESKIGESNEFDARLKIPDVCCLFVLHFYLFRVMDKKFFKSLWDIYKKVPAVPLIANIMWFPDMFLLTRLPLVARSVDRKSQDAVKLSRQSYLLQKNQNLLKDVSNYFMLTMNWMTKMDSSLTDTGKLLEDLNRKCSLLLQGLKLAWTINHQVKTIMNLHVSLSKPMTKTCVLALCRMIEMIKGIEGTFHRHSVVINESITHIVQHLAHLALTIINIGKKRLVSDKKYSERRLDVLSALVLAEKSLNGPGTKERRLVAYLAMSLGVQMNSFKDDEMANFFNVVKKLDFLCDLKEKLKDASDCSFLYWHRAVFPTYVADLYDNGTDTRSNLIQYMVLALHDSVRSILSSRHESTPEALLFAFQKEIYLTIKKHLLDPLCSDVETELRLHCHYHLQLDDRNPFKVGRKEFNYLFRLSSLHLFNHFVSVKSYVEHYLDKIFYNLTTVALHDWKTYGEMRSLASHKYRLETVDAHLPSQTLEQGLDVLEIMRNIHLFVSNYLYNLNNQIFVERSSNNKHLNTINIRHIANSIRTHGIGVMNTTVNFVYQFLRKKFQIFSQFLYDEHIKSRLIKDLRYFKENKNQNGQKYPFDRAEKFHRGIRKLGLTENGESYLDQFRLLISEIGNAMGFVRMIRSGGIHCCSNAIRFIPDLDDIIEFSDLCKEENLSEETISAASKLDSVISNLSKNFSEGTQYFKLLVDAFGPAFRDPKNGHMRNFFVIVPPLTINFVEESISSKEKLSRKNKVGAAFTDDGFAMGVAYILKLLNLYEEFDSLHWFHSVKEKYSKDREDALSQKNTALGKEDRKLLETMNLTSRRLEIYQQEFDLLNYSLSSARIFFRADLSAEEENAEKQSTNKV